jgi:hypothetical protein
MITTKPIKATLRHFFLKFFISSSPSEGDPSPSEEEVGPDLEVEPASGGEVGGSEPPTSPPEIGSPPKSKNKKFSKFFLKINVSLLKNLNKKSKNFLKLYQIMFNQLKKFNPLKKSKLIKKDNKNSNVANEATKSLKKYNNILMTKNLSINFFISFDFFFTFFFFS